MSWQPPYICARCRSLLLACNRPRDRPPQHFARNVTARTKSTLPTAPVRTRFAPSPTGFLHLGSLRTALFNYLLARATKGSFLLRLEDTDAKRTIAGAEEAIYSDLRWGSLQWDEGPGLGGPHGPYRQSERTILYQDAARTLLENGNAYRCFCSPKRLDQLGKSRKELGLPTDYDRLCASLSSEESADRAHNGEKHVVRLLAPSSYPHFTDIIYGRIGHGGSGANAGIVHKHGEIVYEDPVLLKSDGTPTYHLANVVDDHAMDITHVVRATEWIASTPKHLALYSAFGWEPPAFAHVGLLVDAEGRKLSKRAMDTTLSTLREQGWLKDAVVNFAALLGCSYERRSDVMDLDELVEAFKGKFTKGNTIVAEEKLRYLQRAHAERAVAKGSAALGSAMFEMVDSVREQVSELKNDAGESKPLILAARDSPDFAHRIVKLDARNYLSPKQFAQRNALLFTKPDDNELRNAMRKLTHDVPLHEREVGHVLRRFCDRLRANEKDLEGASNKMPKLVQDGCAICLPRDLAVEDKPASEKQRSALWYKVLRAALVAGMPGPSVADVMDLWGSEETLARLDAAIECLEDIIRST